MDSIGDGRAEVGTDGAGGNLPDSGALGACRNLVIMATKVHEGKADVLTSDMLRAVHRLLVNRSAFRVLETRMEEPRRPLAKVG